MIAPDAYDAGRSLGNGRDRVRHQCLHPCMRPKTKGSTVSNISRRSFIQAAAATAGSAAVVSSASAAEAPRKQVVAGQPPAWLGTEPVIDASEISETLSTDLLIIGAGNAGMAAAATAADFGMDFIVAEKGGVVAATRNWYGAINIPECYEAGKEVDTIRLNNEMRRAYCGKNDMRVSRVWIDESAEMHVWMREIMASYGYQVNFDQDQGLGRGGVGLDMYVPPEQVNYIAREDVPEEYASMKRNALLEDYIGKKGYEISYLLDLAKFVKDESGAVVGAIFANADGAYTQINANNTIVCTGGYSSDYDMLEGINPILARCLTINRGWPNNTGMGIKAAMWAGAMKDPAAMAMVFDRGAVPPGTKAGWITMDDGSLGLPVRSQDFNPGTQPFLKMNLHGERFFNESANYDWANYAAAGQPGGVYLEVWDANFAEDVNRFHGLGCSVKSRAQTYDAGRPLDDFIKDWFDDGSVVKADTLEEVADGLGLTGEYKENFLKTCERYNELYDAQEDPDFGKEPYLLSQLRTPPFYGITLGGALLATGDGLRINPDMQVLDTDGEVIPGLYAAGDCSGSFFADGYYNLTHGCACGRTLTFARHAVRHIAGEI